MTIQYNQLPLPPLAQQSFLTIDYADSYSSSFKSPKNLTVDDCIKAFFKSSSPVTSLLFQVRNKLMQPLGLKVGNAKDRERQLREFKIEKGNALGLFKVMEISGNEVLLGEDDKHLNFRISFFLNRSQPDYYFTLSTTVQINNHFGKLYFFIIKPFHKLIVPGMAKRIVKQLM